MKKTKIICTVGPSTDNIDVLCKMINAGLNVARFNFSHGGHDDHKQRIALVRQAAKKMGRPVALMLDTKGPEIRLGILESKVLLRVGQKFTLTTRDVVGNAAIASVSYEKLPLQVRRGDHILLADGLITLQVNEVVDQDVITTVLNEGEISSRKRVAMPGVAIDLPALSEQDVKDLLFGAGQKMDFVAASFVQRAADVLAIRKVLEDANCQMDIFAKIENSAGVANIDEIIKVSDGIMVARGDLGVEIPAEEVPLVQKSIIQKCNKAGKPVITATQMLESMINNPRPTRAEASDIANAIFDGTDAIMLSGETASGMYPVESVQTMAKIAERTEASLNYSSLLLAKGILSQTATTDAISHATVQIAYELNAAAIITATESGYTPRMVSKYRPQANIVAITPHEDIVRRMQVLWGVQPVLGPASTDTDSMVANSVVSALKAELVHDGDLVVITAGVPVGTSGTTNMIRVHIVGDIIIRGIGIGNRSVTGNVCIVSSLRDCETKFKPGDILVVDSIDEQTAIYASKAAAIIAEEGGLTSHAAVVGISYGIPVIVGADGATERIPQGSTVTVDASRGIVYQGEINAR